MFQTLFPMTCPIFTRILFFDRDLLPILPSFSSGLGLSPSFPVQCSGKIIWLWKWVLKFFYHWWCLLPLRGQKLWPRSLGVLHHQCMCCFQTLIAILAEQCKNGAQMWRDKQSSQRMPTNAIFASYGFQNSLTTHGTRMMKSDTNGMIYGIF